MVTIRAATIDDDAAIVAIDDATWSSQNSPVPKRGPRSYFDHVDPADMLVAEIDGRVVGYTQLRNAIPIATHRHVLEINGLAVLPEASGRGIGAALIEAVVAEAARRGARKVALRVFAPNDRARRLYARQQFVEEGVLREEFLVEGIFVDDVLMARHLDQVPTG